MAKATLLLKTRTEHGNGVVEMVVWRVPLPVPPSGHDFKYRLVYLVDGQRVIGYDNERGKGDHKHVSGREVPYRFTGIESLITDFLLDVEANT